MTPLDLANYNLRSSLWQDFGNIYALGRAREGGQGRQETGLPVLHRFLFALLGVMLSLPQLAPAPQTEGLAWR